MLDYPLSYRQLLIQKIKGITLSKIQEHEDKSTALLNYYPALKKPPKPTLTMGKLIKDNPSNLNAYKEQINKLKQGWVRRRRLALQQGFYLPWNTYSLKYLRDLLNYKLFTFQIMVGNLLIKESSTASPQEQSATTLTHRAKNKPKESRKRNK